MTDTDQEREDEVLRRMLKTKPTPHKASADKEGDNGNRNRDHSRDKR